ncbi:MAG: FecR domain-containing protein [Steroidobacteraceae bacterium]
MSMQQQIDRLIACRAAEWYELLRNGGAHVEEKVRAEFVDWICESPRHMEAFLAVAASVSFIRGALAQDRFDLQQHLQTATADVVTLPGTTTGRPASPPAVRVRRFRRGWYAAAAAVGILAIGTLIWSARPTVEHFETAIGEQRTLQLAEGSIVNLNALSRITVRFDDSRRQIVLERGEATFKVMHNATRPFSVYAHGAVVEAVGTQFNVYARHDGATTVAVLEGKVRVSDEMVSMARPPAEPMALMAGQVASIRPDGRIERQTDMDAMEAIAWQQRILIFKRTSLEDIVTEFNRYNKSVQFELENIEPGSLRFTGIFSADDPQSLADVLMREPDLRVRRRQNAIVIIGVGVRRL